MLFPISNGKQWYFLSRQKLEQKRLLEYDIFSAYVIMNMFIIVLPANDTTRNFLKARCFPWLPIGPTIPWERLACPIHTDSNKSIERLASCTQWLNEYPFKSYSTMKGLFQKPCSVLFTEYAAARVMNRPEWFSIFSHTIAKSPWIAPLLISLPAATMDAQYLSISFQWLVFVSFRSLYAEQKPCFHRVFCSIE